HPLEALSLFVNEGPDYSVSGTTISPVSGFSGLLTANIVVSDPIEAGDPYPFRMAVAEDVAPVITGQVALSTAEETALTILLSHVIVEDDSPPEALALEVLPNGEQYAVSGNTITPPKDFNGTLSVTVVVSDGTASSAPFPLQVTVTPVNDAPVITGQQSLSTTQGQPVILSVTDFTVEDPDNIYPNDFTLSIVEGANYTVSGNQVVPAAEFSGALTVGVVVNDGQANSAVFQATITVA